MTKGASLFLMLTQQKGKQVRLYILEDDEPALDKLSVATGLDVTTIMTLLVSAGIKACTADGNRLPLPLKFQVIEGLQEITNDPGKRPEKRAFKR